MHKTSIAVTSVCTLLLAGLTSVHAAQPSVGNIVILNDDSESCSLPVPAAGSGKTWQFDLNVVSSPCFKKPLRKIQLVNLPSAAQILMTDAYWCSELTVPGDEYDTKDHWMKIKTTRQPTSTAIVGIHDWYTAQPGRIISPGLQMVEKFNRTGTPQQDSMSCIRVTTSAGPDTPPLPPPASVGSRIWSDTQRESNSFFYCGNNAVMTGRNHRGDENGDTKHECGVVSQSGNTATVGEQNWSIAIHESDRTGNNKWGEGFYFSCPLNQVMTGRQHEGDENGYTKYECATLTSGDRQLDITPGDWSEAMIEYNSEHTCPTNQVMVGRWHRGDENKKGATRYRCATVN